MRSCSRWSARTRSSSTARSAAVGLSRDMFRLSCAIEENGLLAIGADNTEGLFVSSGYFASLDNDANMAFKERYHNHFGQRAPTLNSLGQSTYEGVHFMAALARRAADDNAQLLGHLAHAAGVPLGARHRATSATSAARTRRISPRPAATSSSARSRCSAQAPPLRVRPTAGPERCRPTAIVSSESNALAPVRRAVAAVAGEDLMTLLAWLFGLIVADRRDRDRGRLPQPLLPQDLARRRAHPHRLRRPEDRAHRRHAGAAVPAQGRRDQHADDARSRSAARAPSR